MMRQTICAAVLFLAGCLTGRAAPAAANAAPEYFHLRQGVVFYVANPRGVPFTATVDLKDINTFCQGPQTALLKVYDPSGARHDIALAGQRSCKNPVRVEKTMRAGFMA